MKLSDTAKQLGVSYQTAYPLGIKLEIVNLADNGRDELMQDLVAIITSFSARLYGQRRAKRKTEKISQELSEMDES